MPALIAPSATRAALQRVSADPAAAADLTEEEAQRIMSDTPVAHMSQREQSFMLRQTVACFRDMADRAEARAAEERRAMQQRVADALRGRREAFVVVEGRGGTRTRQALLTAAARSRAELGDAATVRPVIMPVTLKAEDEEQ